MADVTFTYKDHKGKDVSRVLQWADRIKSREGLGVWHVDSQAWKVFATCSQREAISGDYRLAGANGLPMGKPTFQQGLVKHGEDAPSQRFVLRTEWMVGTNFSHTAGSFKTALTRENFPHDKTSTDYKRMQGGASSAQTVGLRDPQGFLKAGLYEPLRFVDVHMSWNPATKKFGPSEVATEILEIANKWGQ